MPQMNCFLWIYFPLLGTAFIAVIFSQVVNWVLQIALAMQDERIRKEVHEPWENRKQEKRKEKARERRQARMEIE